MASVVLSLMVGLLRGNKITESVIGIKRCSLEEWTLISLYVAGTFILTGIACRIVNAEQKIKDTVGKGDGEAFRFEWPSLKKIMAYSLAGGFVSGFFGLGGGSIFNPYLIELGVPPSVSAATTMFMVMLANMATAVMYTLFQSLDLNYAIWLSFWNVLATWYGFSLINSIVRRTGRQSIIIYIMSILIALSAVMTPIFSL
jgi:uncharacterized membrane protein YfcA